MASNVVEYIIDIETGTAKRGLDRVEDSIENVNRDLKKTKIESKKATTALTAIGQARSVWGKVQFAVAAATVAISLFTVTVFKTVKKVTDLTNELNDLSVRSGLTAKTIQGLRQALTASGQSAEGLNEILGGIQNRFAQLSQEGSQVEKKFNSFGIAVKDVNGNLRSNNAILLDGIKKLEGISDASARSRTAVLLFGKAGAKLNQALAAGNFREFLEFTEKFGIDTGPRASKAAADFQKSISALGMVFNHTLQAIVNATDAQNKFIKGMIKTGSMLAFASSLMVSFQDEIRFVTKWLVWFVKHLFLATVQGIIPFTGSLLTLNNTLNDLTERFPKLAKSLGGLADRTIDYAEKNNLLSGAFSKAISDALEFEERLNKLGLVMGETSKENQKQIPKETKLIKKKTEAIRTLNDVMKDLAGKFGIKIFDVDRILEDASLIAQGISRTLKFNVAPTLHSIYADLLKGSFEIIARIEEKINSIGFFTNVGDKNASVAMDSMLKNLGSGLSKVFNDAVNFLGTKIGEKIFKDNFATDLSGSLANKLGEVFGKAGSKMSSALTSGMTKGLSSMLGVISGVMMLFQIAGAIGSKGGTQKEIKKNIEDDIRARAKAIEMGLRVLPSILFEVLPPLFHELANSLIVSLGVGFQKMIMAIKNWRPFQAGKASSQEEWVAMLKQFLRNMERFSILGALTSKRSGGPYIPSARGGIKFTGADDGLAMLHRGEFVVPETGQMPQAVQRTMGMGQGGMTININAAVVESNAIDELVRQIERRFQTFGSSTSPLFGGS